MKVPRITAETFGSFAVAIAAFIIILLGWLAEQQTATDRRADTVARIEAELSAQALSLEEPLRVKLLAVEQSLRILEQFWEGGDAPFDLGKWRSRFPMLLDVTNRFFVTDRSGIVRQASVPGLLDHDVHNRDYFRHAQKLVSDNGRLLLGGASQSASERWQLPVARRLDNRDGSFAGVIVALVDVAVFIDLLEQFGTQPHGRIILLDRRDDRVLASTADSGLEPGQTLMETALIQAIGAQANGVWSGAAAPGVPLAIHAFRTIPERPMTVVVTWDEATALLPATDWEHNAVIFVAGLSVLLTTLAGLVIRDLQRGRQKHAYLTAERVALTARTEQLRATFAGMSDGVMMLDATYRLVEWNDRFAEFAGVPRGILRPGLPLVAILRAQALAGEFGNVDIDAEVNRRLREFGARPAGSVIERIRPNGRVVELRRDPLPDGGIVTLYSDITTRRRAEEQTREALKMAAIGRLTAGVAHDFNNLLGSVIGNAELLVPAMADRPIAHHRLTIIEQAAKHGAHLIAQLMTYARRQPLAAARFDPNELVEVTSDLLRASLDATIEIRICPAPAIWDVMADAVQTEQAVLNLAINARDAMRETGGGTLTITTANKVVESHEATDALMPGAYVTLSVSDTGTGMTEEVLRNAFEPFFTTKAPGHGSGLGLSQVFGFARQSGGDVRIVSRPGDGTIVRIFLPKAPPEAMAEPRLVLRQVAPARSRPPIPEKRLTVLVVEDQADLRETIAAMLTGSGYGVVAAAGGQQAKDLIQQGLVFDLILIDFAMPGMNGLELARYVRTLEQARPIVMMTGYQEEERLQHERFVLNKPFVSATLIEMLHQAASGPALA